MKIQSLLKWIFVFMVGTVLISAFTPRVFAADPKVAELESRVLPEIQEPKVAKVVLKNGAHLYYMQDPELPVIKIKSYFEFGKLSETPERRGITEFFISAWRSGGYGTVKPGDVDETLELYAAKMGAEAGDELCSLELTTLKKHADKLLPLYFGIMREPAFDEGRVDVIRKAILNGIKQRNEDPFPVAVREFAQSLYGQNSPYAWLSTPDTINAITQNDLKKFHAEHVAPEHLWMAATSPLPVSEFRTMLEKQFGDWRHEVKKTEKPAPLKKEWQATLEFVEKSSNQSAIVVGHFGEKRFNPDRFKILLANQVLGGATFGSRLGDRIRTELGLAYGVNSYFDFESDYGIFQIATRTKSESTVQAVQEIKTILAGMIKEHPVTEEELHLAKERVLNELVFEYDSPYNLVNLELKYDYFGYPKNYLSLFPKKIKEVTLAELRETMPRYFFPDRLKILIVGEKAKISGIESLGDIRMVPLDEE